MRLQIIETAMNFMEKTIIFIATGLLCGYSPYMPGTVGTILGLPLCFFLAKTSTVMAILWSSLFIALSIWISHRAQNILKRKDPGCIVVDEIAGFIVALAGIPFELVPVAAGFVIFRFFDIVKPFPIRLSEIKIPGGAGVVIDDLLAGIYANLTLRVILRISTG